MKPNYGDSSQGITKDAVVRNEKGLLDYLERLRVAFPKRPVLVQEYLTGAEYSLTLVGNPDQGLRALPILEVDFSKLDSKLPKILGYELKWEPDSPYWTQVSYHEAELTEVQQQQMVEHSARLFERLGLPRLRPFRLPRRRQGRDQAARGEPQPRLVLGRQGQLDGGLSPVCDTRNCWGRSSRRRWSA